LDVPAYLDYFEKNQGETAGLLADLLIGVTNFFRDREAFEALERDIVPQLIANQLGADDTEGLRIWSAGCSSGEEAYSIAMVLQGDFAQDSGRKIQVFASDVDERAISFARRALYPESIVADVPPVFLRQYFSMEGSHYRIAKKIRDQILFAPHNILSDPPFSRLHLVVCRNLLIYLDRHAQREAMQIFHSALRPGGYLFLGTSETADPAEDLFATIDKKNRIYRATSAGRVNTRSLPTLRAAQHVAVGRVTGDMPRIENNRQDSYATLHQQSLEKFGPASVLVDASFQILHTSGNAGQFLRHMDGEPSYHLLSMVESRIRIELRTVLLQCFKTNAPLNTRVLTSVREGSPPQRVKIAVWPLAKSEHEKPLALIVFNELEPPLGLAQGGAVSVVSRDSAMETLESEVQTLTEQLRDTVAQSDASTEDLRASNEELQAINEELRSATEELETSKEELQSINEELITVNYELKGKVDETAKINDDLQNLISSSDIATIVVDRAMRIKWFTPRTTSIFSLLSTDSGRSLTDITHRLEYPEMMEDAARAFEALRLIEKEVPSSDGRWYLARMLPYRTIEDHISGAILNFVDITSRRQAEQRVREGISRLHMVAESATQFAIITMDTGGRITGWNRAAELMFGYSAAEVEGRPYDLIFTVEDRAQGIPALELREALENGHADDERWHMRKDGTRFFCSGVTHPMVDGRLQGYAKIARDMTEKRIGEDAQQADLERTHASNLLKDEFIAVMSHELRHPLNLIQLNADLLTRTAGIGSVPGAVKAIDAIRRSVHSQSQIIDDLLDISRAKTGKLQLNRVPLKIAAALDHIVEVVRTQALDAQIDLRTNGLRDPGGDELVVLGDPIRVEQIVWNLLSNAIRFTPRGGTISVSLIKDKTYARLEIQDTGIGIPRASLGTVFEMFKQADRKFAGQKPGGLGIGLALVAQLTQAHGGRVAAESAGEGLGSKFCVWLPLADSEQKAPGVDTAGDNRPLHGIRILLVDDSHEILETLAALCEMEGGRVMTAASARAALTLLAENDFDVLVSDIGMPEMDGCQLLSALRNSNRNNAIPAIALSGHAGDKRATAAGFSQQLKKPVPIDELVAKVKTAAKRSRT
jgi:two-component system CheB/CheR fusion protein